MASHPMNTLDTIAGGISGAGAHGIEYLTGTTLPNQPGGKWLWGEGGLDKDKQTASTIAQLLSNRYGSGQKTLNTIGEDPIGALLDASSILTMGGGTLSKLGSAASKAGEAGAFGKTGNILSKVGAGANTVGQAVNPINVGIGLVSKPVLAAKAALIDPLTTSGKNVILGNLLKTAAGNKAKDVYDRFVEASQKDVPYSGNTPGYPRSTAEVASNSGITMLEKAATNQAGSNMGEFSAAQRQVLVDALKKIAKTPEERAAVQRAIQEKAKPLYAGPQSAVVKSDAVLDDLMSRDAMKPAIAQAQKIASNKGESLQMTPAVKGGVVETGLIDANGKPIVKTVESQPATYTGKTLQTIDKGLKEHIGSDVPGAGGLPKGELRYSAEGVAEALKNWLSNNVPGLADANAAYSRMMPELNTMKVADYLYNQLVPSIAKRAEEGANPAEVRARAYTNALDNPKMPQAATGWHGATMQNSVTPDAAVQFENIAKDLSHNQNLAKMLNGKGSDTVQNMITNNIIRQAGLPGFATKFPLISKPIDFYTKLFSGQSADLQAALPALMQNPELALKAMKAAGVDPGVITQALQEFARRAGQVQSVQQVAPQKRD